MKGKRAAAAAALALLATAACGIQPTGIISAGSKPVSGTRAGPVTLYLLKNGRLTPVQRPGLPDHGTLGVRQLGVPPTSEEVRQGLTTQVPAVRLEVTVPMDDGEEPAGLLNVYAHERHRWSRAALGQLACTAEQVRGVRRVELEVNPGDQNAGLEPYVVKAGETPPRRASYLLRCSAFDDLK